MKIEIIAGAENGPVAEFFSSHPTPETDAKASPHIGFYSCATVPAEFARQLERERDEWAKMCALYKQERDEALKNSDVLRDIIKGTVTARNSALTDLTEAERERDEAREDLRRLNRLLSGT